MDLEVTWKDYKIKVLSVKKQKLDDLVFCAYLSKKNPLWDRGMVICACNDILDARSVAKLFMTKKVLLIEQLCYSELAEYKRMLRVVDEGVLANAPLIKAYSFYKALIDAIKKKRQQ